LKEVTEVPKNKSYEVEYELKKGDNLQFEKVRRERYELVDLTRVIEIK